MNIDKFISTSKNLAPAGWKHPQHILDAVSKAKRGRTGKVRKTEKSPSGSKPTQKNQERQSRHLYTSDMDTTRFIELRKLGYTTDQALFIIRNCGTGAGGFSEGNDCAKGKAGKDGDGDGEFEGGSSNGAGAKSSRGSTKSRVDLKEFDEVDRDDTKAVDALYKKAIDESERLGGMIADANDADMDLNDDPRRETDVDSDEYKAWRSEKEEAERIITEGTKSYNALIDRADSLKGFTSSAIAQDKKDRERKEEAKKRQAELAAKPKFKRPRKPKGPRTSARVADEIKELEETERLGKALGFELVDEDTGKAVRDPSIVAQIKELKKEQKKLEQEEKKAAKNKARESKPSRRKRSFAHRLMELRKSGVPVTVAIRMARGQND